MFKDIPNFPNYSINRQGKAINKKRDTVLKSSLRADGYVQVYLYKDSKKYSKYIHRILAQLFIPNPENKPQVNHINSIRNDNSISNLEWVTRNEQMFHAYQFGNMITKRTKYTQLTKKQRKEVIHKYENGYSKKKLSQLYNVSRTTIRNIISEEA